MTAPDIGRSLWAQTSLILRNDFRLFWRDLRSGRLRVFSSLGMMIFLLAAFQGLTILLFLAARGHPPPLIAETVVWWFLGLLMLASAMNNAVTVLFERADFDLLLSAPISPAAILLARLFAMTTAAAATVIFFVIPLVNGAAIGLSARYLFGYAVWLLLAIVVTSVGVWLTLLLVRWLGAHRARTWVQVIAALLGALLYIGFQTQNILGPELRGSFSAFAGRVFQHPAATFIARAGRGDWPALLSILGLAASAAYATTRMLGRIFVTGIQEAGVGRARRSRSRRTYRFGGGLIRATVLKDVRLIIRDPLLLSRVLPSVFYLVPALFPLSRIGHAGAPGLLAPFAVIAAVMLSSQLTAVAAAGEECWDLIRLSPASTTTLRIAKIGAGIALPMTICTAAAIAVGILGRPGLGLFALLIALVSCVGSSWLEVASIRPTPRKDLIQRTNLRKSKMSIGRIAASFVYIAVGTGAVTLAANRLWLFASVASGVVVITAIACVTLMELEDIEFESTTSELKRYDATAV